ncbi:unnamed protein product [Caenorhabditis angaria]|uniref:Uncharacterized protein n=1 Tax=Caenorhabditis angaria TaxID=860376 RepID=A0A9P1IDK1_9PELO|nr:unnamed protein product [Caenorhabditis angaria]
MNIPFVKLYDCPLEYEFQCDLARKLVYLELIAIDIQFALYAITIYVAIGSPFHFNLKFIGVYILSGYFTFLGGRLIIGLHEVGVFSINGGSPENTPLLVISSCLQYFFMACACSIGLALSVERFVATVHVDNYEYNKRKWVSFLMCLELLFGSTITAIILLFDLVVIYIMIIIGQLINGISFIIYLALFYINKKRSEFAMMNHKKYSLSFRFQLNENLQVMTLFRNIVLLTGFLNLIFGGVMIGQYMEQHGESRFLRLLYFHLAFNFLSIVYSALTLILLLLSVKLYRQYFFKIPIVYAIVYPIFGRCYESEFRATRVQKLTTSAETETYFTNLAAQWDNRYQKVL